MPVKFHAVFDGHNGVACALFCKDNLGLELEKKLKKYCGSNLSLAIIKNALTLCLIDLSRSFKGIGGSTVCLAVMIDDILWIVSLGDSRAILINNDAKNPGVMQLSSDQKVHSPGIKAEFLRRGGSITFADKDPTPRLHGVAMGRSLGNHHLMGVMSARANVTYCVKPSAGWANYILILCTDGVTGVASSAQIAKLAHRRMHKVGWSAEGVAGDIIQVSLEAKSRDNITVSVNPLVGD